MGCCSNSNRRASENVTPVLEIASNGNRINSANSKEPESSKHTLNHQDVQILLDEEHKSLTKLAKPLLDKKLTCEILLPHEIAERVKEEEAALKQKRRARRKKAKLDAEAAEKWMVICFNMRILCLCVNIYILDFQQY